MTTPKGRKRAHIAIGAALYGLMLFTASASVASTVSAMQGAAFI